MKNAEGSNYLGRLTEAEAKQTINKHFSLDRWSEQMVFLIVNDTTRFDYDSSFSNFVRHAVTLLLDYYRQKQLFGENQGYAREVLTQVIESRLAADRAMKRSEYIRNIRVYDDEFAAARKIGDYAYIARQLGNFQSDVDNAPSESIREILRGAVAQSIEIRSAVMAFYDWTHAPYRHDVGAWDEKWPGQAEYWVEFFEEVSG